MDVVLNHPAMDVVLPILTTLFVGLGVGFLYWIAKSIIDKLSPSVVLAQAENTYTRNVERLPKEVRVFADAGQKLDATRWYKKIAGLDLMESKKVVEAYMHSRDQYARALRAKYIAESK